jgi:hypothetical protein
MYIPMVEIPGCQLGRKNDNHRADGSAPMEFVGGESFGPRETVVLPFSSLPTYEAAAEFYSYLAYPDPIDVTQRKKYSVAVARWAVLERGKLDSTWNESAKDIRPIIFSQPEKLFLDTYRRGGKIWWRRAQYASMMLLPHMLGPLFDGLQPSVGNTSLVAARIFDYEVGSQKTIESRIWAPTKPIAHAAAATLLCLNVLNDPAQEWDEEHDLCYRQPFLATLFYEDVFTSMVLRVSELLRDQISRCERFRILESDTIRFVAG